MKKAIILLSCLISVVLLSGCSVKENHSDKSVLNESEFKSMYKDPENYINSSISFKGKIFMPTSKEKDKIYIQVFSDISNKKDNIMIISDNTNLKLNVNNIVDIKGTLSGTAQGTNGYGKSIKVPVVNADSISKVN